MLILFFIVFHSMSLNFDQDFMEKFQVQLLKEGNSNIYPKQNDELLIHYNGMTMDGNQAWQKVFDSSILRNQPFKYKFGSKGVIDCWNLAFERMTLGDKIAMVCPSKFAYGEHGVGTVIPPNSDLMLEFELLGIGQERIEDL